MNMKRIQTLFFAISLSILIASCASMSGNQKRLIGTWKAEKVEKHNIPDFKTIQTSPTANTNTQKSKTDNVADTNSVPVAKEASKAEKQLNRFIQMEEGSKLTVNKDKTAIRESLGKTVHATWKLKKGTILMINVKETGKKFTANIQHITDTSLVVLEPLPIGALKVTYKKEKK